MKGLVMATIAAMLLGLPQTVRAATDQEVVDAAYVVAEHLSTGTGQAANVRELLHRARGILIVPELVKGGLILGGQGGEGVLLTRDADGGWSYPAFYTMSGGSLGLQIGVEVSKIVLVIMSEKSLEAVMRDEFKVGGEAGGAVATVGSGTETALSSQGGADIYAFAESKGLFGGVAVEGSAINPRPNDNQAYYGRPVTVADIVVKHSVSNKGADQLRTALAQISASK